MPELAQNIDEIVRTVWTQVLALPCTREEHGSPQPSSTTSERVLTGVVQIHGEWDGVILLQCRETLARRATNAMLGLNPNEIDMSDMRETMAELANITGGNFKARLKSTCSLGLPMVVDGDDFRIRMPGRARALQCAFSCDDEAFTVMVMQRVA